MIDWILARTKDGGLSDQGFRPDSKIDLDTGKS
jgi:hypothetical protein